MLLTGAIGSYIFKQVFLYQVLASLATYCIISAVRFYIRRNRRYQLLRSYGYDGPKPWLFLDGNLSQSFIGNQIHEYGNRNHKLYGPTWAENHGDVPVLVTTEPGLIKHVFLDNSETFSEKTSLPLDVSLAHGILFSPHKDKWRLYRRIIATPLNRMKILGLSSTQFVADSTQSMMDYIDSKAEKPTSAINLYKLFKCNALHMISEIALKIPIGMREDEPNVEGLDNYLAKMDGPLARASMSFPCLFSIMGHLINIFIINCSYMKSIYSALDRRFAMTSKNMDEEIKRTGKLKPIDEANEPVIDTLIRLVRAKKLEYREYVGNVDGILIAGYHTTSTTLIYAIWCLAKHQDIQERLYFDLMMNGHSSKYLDQVISEVLRMYPVLLTFTTRVAAKSIQFEDKIIPEGTLVVYPVYQMHHDRDYWKDPERFNPERFAEGKHIDQVYYAPFGMGVRRCLGNKLAMLEMRVLISDLILRYKLSLVSPKELELITCGFFMSGPQEEIKIMLEKRPFDMNNNC